MRKLLTALACLFFGCRDGGNADSSAAKQDASKDDWEQRVVWLQGGDQNNPFPQRVLDCRAVALGFTAMTSDRAIATSFNQLRTDDGRSLIGSLPKDDFIVPCDLRFPYNGKREDGVLFSAPEMEDKWDFFAYDSRLYVRRSWTGLLLHVAELKYTDKEVVISTIHSNREVVHGDAEFAEAHLRFLILTHLGRLKLPFPIPPDANLEDGRAIALAGFSSYGRRAEFAFALKQ